MSSSESRADRGLIDRNTGADQWSAFDDMIRRAPADSGRPMALKLAFYGRCSTEDNQDPDTSREWQLRAARALVEPVGGEIVAEYFDVGISRSLPWKRREQAKALLKAIGDPKRAWDAVVVGEGQRCFFGSQFADVAPLFEHYGIALYVPELGGAYNSRNSTHYVLMSITGGMGRSERQVVQTRVRLGMAAQVEVQGRFQGGRPPFGYTVEAIGPHPNPRKAAEGYQLKRLTPDPATAPAVQRIFAEYLGGRTFREIADGLNSDGVACPSAHRPEQNPHRRGDGWQISTLSTILSNPRYTGFEYWGKAGRVEELADPDDVSLGYQVRFRRAAPQSAVRSRQIAHEPLVSVKDFIEAQRLTSDRGGRIRIGVRGVEKQRASKQVYAMRGVLRCRICNRKMEASQRGGILYFRCRSRDLVPGSEVLARHPANFYVRHDELVIGLHAWLGGLFSPDERERTIKLLADAHNLPLPEEAGEAQNEARRHDLRRRRDRLQDAIEAGADPAALVDRLNAVHRELAVIEAETAAQRTVAQRPVVDAQALGDLLDSLTDVAKEVFTEADPAELEQFYRSIGLAVSYDHESRSAEASVTLPVSGHLPTGGELGVRGGT
jgi:DNA invertase Pin-like site-specific DNA recombinase